MESGLWAPAMMGQSRLSHEYYAFRLGLESNFMQSLNGFSNIDLSKNWKTQYLGMDILQVIPVG